MWRRRIALSPIGPNSVELQPRDRRDHHERKSILRGSGRGREIRRGFWLGAGDCDLLYQQPFDPVGDHPRHFWLALRDLCRAVSMIAMPADPAHPMTVISI